MNKCQKQFLEFIKENYSKLSVDTVLQYFQLYSNKKTLNLVNPSKENMINAQQYKSKYYQSFLGISKYTNMSDYETQINLKNHHIRILNQIDIKPTHLRPIINVKSIQRDGAVIIYQIFLSKFQLQIILLNFEKSAPSVKKKQSLGGGKDVEVRIQKSSNRAFAVKRCFFDKQYLNQEFKMKANKIQIEEIITQVAITKICSLYKIGPAIDTEIGFDLLCFNNCIEFHLQLCLNSQSLLQLNTQIMKKLQRDLKRCLYIMHRLGIVHRDIKPENVLFSRLCNYFILSDFGLSHPIIEPIGYMTHMKERRGTLDYMLDQFKQLKQQGYIDLYENDLQALQKTVIKLKEDIKRNQILKSYEVKEIEEQTEKSQNEYQIFEQPRQGQKIQQSKRGNQFKIYQSESESSNREIMKNQQSRVKVLQFQYNELISQLRSQKVQYVKQVQLMPQPQYIKQQQKPNLQSKQIIRLSQRSMMSQINYEFLKLKYDALRTTRKFTATIQEVKLLTTQQIIQLLEIISDDPQKIADLTEFIKELKLLDNQEINKVIQRLNQSNLNNQINKQSKVMDEFKIRIQGYNQNQLLQVKLERSQVNLSEQFVNKIINIIKHNLKRKDEPDILDLFKQLHKTQFQKSLGNQLLQQLIQIRNMKAKDKDFKKNKKKITSKQVEITQTEYKQRYDHYFSNINNLITNDFLPQKQILQSHRIRILESNEYHKTLLSYTKPSIYIKYIETGQSIVGYKVIIGKFQLQIILFNFKQNALAADNIGYGCFGQIRLQKSNDKQFVVKRQYFKQQEFFEKEFQMKANKAEIQLAIIQFSIYKICSLYKIGPAIDTFIGFDLLCFNDCIQFHLQVCETLNSEKIIQSMRQDKMEGFYNDIKRSIYLMHSFKIVHKDIKPDNILFSKKYNKFVLSDFGISHPILEDIGNKTQTYKQGTFHYMSNEMKMIQRKGLVNLYQNDIHGFKISLMEQYIRIFQSNSQNRIIGKMKQDNKKKSKNEISSGSINYTYMKFKYFASKMQAKLHFKIQQWQQLNQKQMVDIANTISQSTEKNKIKQFYNFLLQNRIDQRFSHIKKYMNLYLQKLGGKMKLMEPKQICNIERLMFSIRVNGYNDNTIFFDQQLKKKFKKISNKMKIMKINESVYLNRRPKGKNLKQKIDQVMKQGLRNDNQKYQFYMQLIKQFYGYSSKVQLFYLINNLNFKMNQRQRIDYVLQIMRQDIKVKGIQKQFQQLMNKNQTNSNPYFKIHLDNLSIIYFFLNNKPESLKYSLQNISCIKLIYGQMHPSIVDAYIFTANIYFQMGIFKLSRQYCLNSLKISMQLFGQVNSKLYMIYKQLGLIYSRQLKYQLSLQFFFKSLEILKKMVGLNEKLKVGGIYYQISNIYKQLNQYQLSIKYCLKYIQYFENIFGKKSQEIANAYAEIAKIYTHFNRFVLALDYLFKSVAIIKQTSNKQLHRSFLNIYQQIEIIYYNIKQYQMARQYCNKTIQNYIFYHGQVHPSVAFNYHQMALILKQLQQYKLAIQYLMKSIEIHKKYFGQIHLSLSTNYYQCALVYIEMKQHEMALEYCFKCILIYKLLLDEISLPVATVYNTLCHIYAEQNKLQFAIQYCLKSIFIKYTVRKCIDHHLADFQNLAKLTMKISKYVQACRFQRQSLFICLKTNPINYSQMLRVIYNLGVMHQKLCRPIQAYYYFQSVYQIRSKQIPSEIHLLQQSLTKIQEIKKQYPEYVQNYKTHLQFVKNINVKYSKLHKNQIMKLLISKKRILKFTVSYFEKVTKKLKLILEIVLCYKYLNCTMQTKRYLNKAEQICNTIKSSKQRQIFKREISYMIKNL